ncbi:MAG: DegV family protein [Lachnospiraceae bacterium]|nr:DegV family protein [Lachnospiraceae bacterium]
MKIRIITDSASDITDNKREDLTVIPMTISFGEEQYQDGITLSHKEFYEKLIESDTLPTTSQIPPYAFQKAIEEAAGQGEKVIIITISSRLSGTWQSAMIAAENYSDSVYVVDSENVTVGEHILVEYALRMKDNGMTVEAIVEELESIKKRIRLVALLDTLEYLKKGGRVSKTVAFAGEMLSIKPVVAIENGEVVVIGKARGSKKANNFIIERIQESGGIDFDKPYFLGYTGLSDQLMHKYVEDNSALWADHVKELPIETVGGTIGTHAGPGAIAVAWVSK